MKMIDKADVVAEIERLIKKNELYLDDNVSDAVRYQKTGAYSVLCDLRHFLDTLEVKEAWKPSDKQIEALDFAADCIVPAEFCFKRKELKGLLEQLKKLREE